MAEDREALLQHYRQTREEMLAAIAGLSDDRMTERTLDGWSVKDHLVHLAFWDELRAAEVERIAAGHASVWRLSGEQDEALNALVHEARTRLTLEQVVWEVAASRQRLLNAIAAATERGLDASLYGEAGLNSGHEAEHTGWIRRWRGEISGNA